MFSRLPMSETVVVVAPSPSSAPSAPTPDEPTADIVEVIHDDARDLGYALARLDQHDTDINIIAGRIAALEVIASAQADATAAIVSTVEETVETVEDIAEAVADDNPADEDEGETFTPEPDRAPGKTHPLRRSWKEWRGRE